MPYNKGLYKRYNVTKTNGKPLTGYPFVLEVGCDPFARIALIAYRDALQQHGGYDEFTEDLTWLLAVTQHVPYTDNQRLKELLNDAGVDTDPRQE